MSRLGLEFRFGVSVKVRFKVGIRLTRALVTKSIHPHTGALLI